jgi:AcrR family transcriptional regulator
LPDTLPDTVSDYTTEICELQMSSITRPSAASGRYGDVEAKLLNATEELLAGGATFTELGIQRIAAKAEVARSTFYVYFRDKTELLLRLTQRLGEASFSFFEDWSPGADDAKDQLCQIFCEVTSYYRRNAHLLTAVLEVAAYDRAFATFWDHRLDPFLSNVRALLAEEQMQGRTAASLDAVATSRVIVSASMQAIARQIVHGNADSDDVVAREVALVQWYGAYRRPE